MAKVGAAATIKKKSTPIVQQPVQQPASQQAPVGISMAAPTATATVGPVHTHNTPVNTGFAMTPQNTTAVVGPVQSVPVNTDDENKARAQALTDLRAKLQRDAQVAYSQKGQDVNKATNAALYRDRNDRKQAERAATVDVLRWLADYKEYRDTGSWNDTLKRSLTDRFNFVSNDYERYGNFGNKNSYWAAKSDNNPANPLDTMAAARKTLDGPQLAIDTVDDEKAADIVNTAAGLGAFGASSWAVNPFTNLLGTIAGVDPTDAYTPYFMTTQQTKDYNWILENKGKAAAEEYRKSLNPQLKANYANWNAQEFTPQFAAEHPALASLLSVAEVYEAPLATLENGLNLAAGKDIDFTSPANVVAGQRPQLRSEVTKGIESKTGQFIYGTGMSMLDNLALMPLGGLGSAGEWAMLGSLGSSAANDRARELIQQGVPANEAYFWGLMSGVIEGVTEKVSLDKLLSTSWKGGVANFFKNMGIQGIIGGSEEFASNILNLGLDTVRSVVRHEGVGPLEKEINELEKKGVPRPQATSQVILGHVKDAGMDFAGGFVAEGLMGAPATAVNYNNLVNAGTNIVTNEDGTLNMDAVESLMERGHNMPADTISHRQADLLQQKINEGKAVTAREAAILYANNYAAEKTMPYDELLKLRKKEIDPGEWQAAKDVAMEHVEEFNKDVRKLYERTVEEAVTNGATGQQAAAEFDRAYTSGFNKLKAPQTAYISENTVRDIMQAAQSERKTETQPRRMAASRANAERNLDSVNNYAENGSKVYQAAVREALDNGATAEQARVAFNEVYSNVYANKPIPTNTSIPLSAPTIANIREAALKDRFAAENKARADAIPVNTNAGVAISDPVIRQHVEQGRLTETVDFADEMGKLFGEKVSLVAKLPQNGQINLRTGEIVVALNTDFGGIIDRDRAMRATLGHELAHRMRQVSPKTWNKFTQAVIGSDIDQFNADVNTMIRDTYKGDITRDAAQEEVLADYIGNRFFSGDIGSLRAMVESIDEMPTRSRFIQHIVDMANWIKSKLTGRQASNAQRIEDEFRKMFKETQAKVRQAEAQRAETQAQSSKEETRAEQNEAPAEKPATKFSMKNHIEQTRDLIAIHNLTEENLLDSVELGGFPMPSIAIIRSNQQHSNYGPISVLFDKSTIDPQASKYNKVYSGDAWTPTFPQVDIKLDEKMLKDIGKRAYKVPKDAAFFNYVDFYDVNLTPRAERFKSESEFIESLKDDLAIKQLFLYETTGDVVREITKVKEGTGMTQEDVALAEAMIELLSNETFNELPVSWGSSFMEFAKEHGEEFLDAYRRYDGTHDGIEKLLESGKEKIAGSRIASKVNSYFRGETAPSNVFDREATTAEINSRVDNAEYDKWLHDTFDGIVEKKGIRNEKDTFTSSGNRRSWEALHNEVTLENVVKAMRSDPQKGAGVFGLGSPTAAATKEFSSVSEIREHKGQLRTMAEEDYEKIKSEFVSRFSDIADRFNNRPEKFGSLWDTGGVICEDISKSQTKETLRRRLKAEEKYGYHYSDDLVDDLWNLIQDIQQMPTGYFEAKPQRAVRFDEWKKVIIPDNSPQKLRNWLDNKGVEYAEYKAGNEDDRMRVVNEEADAGGLKFSRRASDNDYMAAVNEGNMRAAQRMVDEAAVEAMPNLAKTDRGRPLHLYHGTPRFGFTTYEERNHDKPFIYTSTLSSVSAHYAGDNHYAGVRPIGRRYEGGDSIKSIIKDAETVWGAKLHVATEAEKEKTFTDVRNEAIKIADGLDERYTEFNNLDSDNKNDRRVLNAMDWAQNLFWVMRDSGFDTLEDLRSGETGYTPENLAEDVERFKENIGILKDYYSDNYKNLNKEQKEYLGYIIGYDAGDAAIDIEYKIERILGSDTVLANDNNSYMRPEDIRKSLDLSHEIGAYDLYGDLGSNPLEFDANGAQFWAIKVPEMGDDYHSTDAVSKWALENGYTSVIMHNIYDYGDKADNYVFFNPNQIKSADSVTYDDNGNVIPLSERFQSDNPDIRYSKRSSSSKDAVIRRQQETIDRLRHEMVETHGVEPDPKAIATAAVQFGRDWQSTMPETEIKDAFADIAKEFALYRRLSNQGADPALIRSVENRFTDKCTELANKVVKSAAVLVGDNARAQELKQFVWNHPIQNDLSFKKEFGDFPALREAIKGKIKLAKDGMPISRLYESLNEQFSDYPLFQEFEGETLEPVDMLLDLLDLINDFDKAYNPYDTADAVDVVASEIMNTIFDAPVSKPTFADRKAAEVNAAKAEAAQAREQARKQTPADVKAYYEAKLNDIREQRDRYLADLVQAYKDRSARAKESEDRARVLRTMKQAERLAKKSNDAFRAEIKNLLGNYDTVAQRLSNHKAQELSELESWVRRNKDNPDAIITPQVSDKLARYYKDHLSDMTIGDVRALGEALLEVIHRIRTENRIIGLRERYNTVDLGKQIIQDVRNAPGTGPSALARGMDKFLINGLMRPETEFLRLVGFNKNSPLYEYTFGDRLSLLTGQKTMQDYQREANERYFRQFLDDKEFMKSITGKNARTIEITGTDEQGKQHTVKVTPDFVMAMYMHSQNVQNLMHICNYKDEHGREVKAGGMTVPDYKLYKDGKKTEAYNAGTKLTFTRSQFNDQLKGLTPKEMEFIKAAQRYYSEMSQPRINDVSEQLLGYSLAKVDNYFRINTDPDYRGGDMENIRFDGTIEGMGWTKERVNGKNPILLIPLSEQLQKDIVAHSKYVGMAIPIRNFSKIYGITENTYAQNADGKYELQNAYASSVIKEINKKHPSGADTNYIRDLLADIQNPVSNMSALDKVFAALRSKYAGSVLTLNLGVALKQAASFPTAAAEIGWAPIIKTVPQFGKAMASFAKPANQKTIDFISKYSPLMRLRTEGMSTQELADMQRLSHKIPGALNWIQNVDVGTVAALWKASEYYVKQNFKNLKPGTEEFYQKVGDVHTRVITKTQPNYSELQRPGLLRSKSEITKTLMMFKTQPFQNFNILYEAVGSFKAAERAYKANPTEENKAGRNEARKRLAWAISSQVVSNSVFAAMQVIWDIMRRKEDPLDDEDKNVQRLNNFFKNMISSWAGMVPGGSQALEVVEKWVDDALVAMGGEKYFDNKVYGFELDASIEGLNKMVDLITNLPNLGGDIFGLIKGDENKEEYLRDLFKQFKDVSTFFGIPTNNVINLTQATMEWAMTKGLGYNDAQARYMADRLLTGVDKSKHTSTYYGKLAVAAGDETMQMFLEDPVFTEKSKEDVKKAQFENDFGTKEIYLEDRGSVTEEAFKQFADKYVETNDKDGKASKAEIVNALTEAPLSEDEKEAIYNLYKDTKNWGEYNKAVANNEKDELANEYGDAAKQVYTDNRDSVTEEAYKQFVEKYVETNDGNGYRSQDDVLRALGATDLTEDEKKNIYGLYWDSAKYDEKAAKFEAKAETPVASAAEIPAGQQGIFTSLTTPGANELMPAGVSKRATEITTPPEVWMKVPDEMQDAYRTFTESYRAKSDGDGKLSQSEAIHALSDVDEANREALYNLIADGKWTRSYHDAKVAVDKDDMQQTYGANEMYLETLPISGDRLDEFNRAYAAVSNNNDSVTQAELAAALNAMGVTLEEGEAIWAAYAQDHADKYGSGWKKTYASYYGGGSGGSSGGSSGGGRSSSGGRSSGGGSSRSSGGSVSTQPVVGAYPGYSETSAGAATPTYTQPVTMPEPVATTHQTPYTGLQRHSEGGNVDLTYRPVLKAVELRRKGWGGVLSDTVRNFVKSYFKDGKALNFTPIVLDKDGNYVRTLSPNELREYAEAVLKGEREDDMKLQVGTAYEGTDAMAQAEKAAAEIEKLDKDYTQTA